LQAFDEATDDFHRVSSAHPLNAFVAPLVRRGYFEYP
jgi:hypothetical protein